MKKSIYFSLMLALTALEANAATEQPSINSTVSASSESELKSTNGSGATVELLSGMIIPVSRPEGYNPETSFGYGLGAKYRINKDFNIGARWLTSKIFSTSGSYNVLGISGTYSAEEFASIYAATAEYSPISNLFFGGIFGLANLTAKASGSGALSGSISGSKNGTAVGAYVGYDIHVVGGFKISPQLNFAHLSIDPIDFNTLAALATLKYDF